MRDPADDDQQRHAEEHLGAPKRRRMLEVKRDWMWHG
jgi:hypothetical protein